MTPKEKAKQLSMRYMEYADSCIYSLKDKAIMQNDEQWNESAKQCSLIAVDELINEAKTDRITFGRGKNYLSDKEYWQEVKAELNKL